MADKETKLSIVLRTVDKATAGIRAVAARLDAVTKPFRDFKEALSDLRSKSGLDDVIGGFKGVGGAITDLLGKVAMIGGVVGVAVAGMFKLVGEFDDLGDKAEAMGVSVDFLAQMRYAAEASGASVEQLDSSMQGFATNLGLARAGTGKFAAFLKQTNNPALLEQLKHVKNNEEAFGILAGAVSKLTDPAKRAAAAQKLFGDAALAPLLSKGPEGIKKLREEYLKNAGSQEAAAAAAGRVDDAQKKLKASIDGVKAALVEGLAPALEGIVKLLGEWFSGHREDIKEWAASLGKKLPGAIQTLKSVLAGIVDTIKPFVDSTMKLKVVAVALAAVILGPLISSIVSLGIALATTPVGWIVAAIAALAIAWYEVITNWEGVKAFFVEFWDALGEKFGWARNLILTVLGPLLFLPTLIAAHWEGITGFFKGLWDGVTAVFTEAWEIIGGIVDKVVGAVNTVKDAIGSVFESSGIADAALSKARGEKPASDVIDQTMANLNAVRASSEARITVDFANAPRGTRVNSDAKGGADVDLSVGYQMLPGFP